MLDVSRDQQHPSHASLSTPGYSVKASLDFSLIDVYFLLGFLNKCFLALWKRGLFGHIPCSILPNKELTAS